MFEDKIIVLKVTYDRKTLLENTNGFIVSGRIITGGAAYLEHLKYHIMLFQI